MRILAVTHYFPAHGGGIEIVAGHLAREFARFADVTWCASDTDAAPPGLPGNVVCVPLRAFNAAERRIGVPYPLFSPASLARLRRAAAAADAVHVHDFHYHGSVVAAAAARRRGVPVVVTQHVGAVPYDSAVLRLVLRAVQATLGRRVLGRADRVVFVSDVVRAFFAERVTFRAEPVLIPNGVDTAAFAFADAAQRASARASLGLAGGAPLLLFVGRFVEKKGLPILREIAAALPEATFVCAGWGPLDPQGWSLPNVRVVRGLHGAQLVPLYQAADLLVLPSVGEGFPLVIQEAMSCGTPALVGADTARAVPDAASELHAEPVSGPGTATRWIARIRDLLADSRLAESRPRVAATARRLWSWRGCAEKYEALFDAGRG